MLKDTDLLTLELVDKNKTLKEMKTEFRSEVAMYNKLKRFQKHNIIKKVSTKPTKYALTFKGAMLTMFLRQFKELL